MSEQVKPETVLDVMVIFNDKFDMNEKQFETYFEAKEDENDIVLLQTGFMKDRSLWLKILDLIKKWGGRSAVSPRRFVIPKEKKVEPKAIPIDKLMPPSQNNEIESSPNLPMETPQTSERATPQIVTVDDQNHKVEHNSVEINKIIADKDFMMRDGYDKKLVAQYQDNLEKIVKEHPIVVFDTPRGLLLSDGFHRLVAARQLNWEKIQVKVRKGSVQDAFAYACLANLKHGKPLKPQERKKAICEVIKLNVTLSNVQISEIIGVSDETIRRFRQELEARGEIKPQDARLGADGKMRELPTSTIVEVDPFDGWFNNHIINDDIFNILPNDPLKYDLILIDPPYGITEESWDKHTKFDLLAFTRRWLNLVLQKLKPTGRLFVFWSRKYMFELKPLFDEIQHEYPLNFGGIIIWNFRNVMSRIDNPKKYRLTWEPIFYFYGLDAPNLNWDISDISGKQWSDEKSDVWSFAIPQSNFKDKKVHPTQKPLELYKRIISTSTKPNDLILDPFAGSGTTGYAAHILGREFKLIEKNSEYCERIRERLKEVF